VMVGQGPSRFNADFHGPKIINPGTIVGDMH